MELTSKEMERRSGVPRANIRYYEAEGLLAPARSGNGYRDYSEEDLRTLEKIKLLRRLGVSIEELRALRSGRADLAAVLRRRQAEADGERSALERVERVCEDLRESGTTFDALEPERYLAELDAPSLPEAGERWWLSPPASALPEEDVLPPVCNVPRRLFARWFDKLLLTLLLFSGMSLTGSNPALLDSAGDFLLELVLLVLVGVLEPLSLHLFGTTPGKALLGLRITGPDGERLSFGAGVERYLGMLWHGLGLGIPIWSLVQMFRTLRRCANGEPQPWDRPVAYAARPFRARYAGAMAAALVAALAASEAVNSACQLPPNRGDLTVAEFAENYNRQASYLGFGGGQVLDGDGRWQDPPDNTHAVVISIAEEWPGSRDFRYTVEEGRVTAVTLTGTLENAEGLYATPDALTAEAVMALVWGREEAPFWSWQRQDQLDELSRADWEHGFALRWPGVTATAEVEQEGFLYNTVGCWYAEQAENRLSFTYTVALDN